MSLSSSHVSLSRTITTWLRLRLQADGGIIGAASNNNLGRHMNMASPRILHHFTTSP